MQFLWNKRMEGTSETVNFTMKYRKTLANSCLLDYTMLWLDHLQLWMQWRTKWDSDYSNSHPLQSRGTYEKNLVWRHPVFCYSTRNVYNQQNHFWPGNSESRCKNSKLNENCFHDNESSSPTDSTKIMLRFSLRLQFLFRSVLLRQTSHPLPQTIKAFFTHILVRKYHITF